MEADDHIATDIPIEGEKKVVVVGQTGCGKSSLIASFVSESSVDITRKPPKVTRRTISFGREEVQVVLCEEDSNPQYSFFRMLDYEGASAALVCFAWNDAWSIRSVPKWIEEIRQLCPLLNLTVVGLKLDLKHETAVSVEEWMDLERTLVRFKYLECSAKTGEGVSHLVRVIGTVLMNQQLRENSAIQH